MKRLIFLAVVIFLIASPVYAIAITHIPLPKCDIDPRVLEQYDLLGKEYAFIGCYVLLQTPSRQLTPILKVNAR